MMYPGDARKSTWDIIMTIVLLITSFQTPYAIGFRISSEIDILGTIIDSLFAIDIFVCFNTAFFNEDQVLIDNRKKIAIQYMQGWFLIDILSIMPFDIILESSQYNSLIRFAKFGKLYKLVKLTRLSKMFKLFKKDNKVYEFIKTYMNIGLGFERLFFFILMFVIIVHTTSCLWIAVACMTAVSDRAVTPIEGQEHSESENQVFDKDFTTLNFTGTWFDKVDLNMRTWDNEVIYVTSLYWTVTTITTVGYGDIAGANSLERLFCSMIMVIGVISFSFATSSLSSILQNYDQTNAQYTEKMNILNEI